MRAYRVAQIAAAIGGMSLAIIAGTTEAIASITAIDVVSGFRAWMVALIVIAALSVCTAIVVERQATAAERQDRIIHLLSKIAARRDAEEDYAEIRSRLRDGTGNITTLYPDKE